MKFETLKKSMNVGGHVMISHLQQTTYNNRQKRERERERKYRNFIYFGNGITNME